MKLRLNGDSIRLRLAPKEIEQLRLNGRFEVTTHFSAGRDLTYVLQLSSTLDDLDAYYDGSNLVVEMPSRWVDEWARTDKVGFEASRVISGGRMVQITIEKDFQFMSR